MDSRPLGFGCTLALSRFARRLYRGRRPHVLARGINRVAAAVFARGVAPDYVITLDVRGRRSGRTIWLPLMTAVLDQQRYLVSNLGTKAAWAHNVKATSGRAVLRHGRTEHVRLEEFAIDQRAPVLKAFLKLAPGARPHIPVDKNASLDEFAAIASEIPVVRVLHGDSR